MPIRIDGLQSTLRANSKARVKDSINIQEGLEKCAKILLKVTLPFVPVDKGDLKESGAVISTGVGMAAVSVVSFGGPSAPHAFIVHERLNVYHKPPTKARFLADTIPKVRGTMTSLLQRQLAVGVRGVTTPPREGL